jgi:putative aldouronate transport system substrate-binding protein
MALMLMSTCFVACGKATPEGEASVSAPAVTKNAEEVEVEEVVALDPVELKVYFLGDAPNDADLVVGEFNEKLKEKINTTIDVNYIGWGELDTKYPLIFSSGESYDIVQVAHWTSASFKQLASKDAFKELTEDMLMEYAPETYKEMTEVAVGSVHEIAVDDKIYAIPQTGVRFHQMVGMIRGDLREKYNLPEVKSVDDVYNYLRVVAENEKGIIPFDVGVDGGGFCGLMFTQPKNLITIGYTAVVDTQDENYTVRRLDNDPEYYQMTLDYFNEMLQLKLDGVIPSDASSGQVLQAHSYLAGKSAFMVWTFDSTLNTYNTVMANNPEWKPEIVDVAPNAVPEIESYSNNGVAIGVSSENAERALMTIELWRTDKELLDLLFMGIEDKHWIAEGDDHFLLGSDSGDYTVGDTHGIFCPLFRLQGGITETNAKILENWADNMVPTRINGFDMNIGDLKTEDAAMSNLIKQYIMPLRVGAFPDPEAALAEYMEKANLAGQAKLYDELESQLAEYVK